MMSKDYFNEIARNWDEMRKGFFSDAVREKAISVVSLEPGQVAADIGAGSGFITEGLLKNGVQVIAVDESEEMLAEMKRKFAGAEGLYYRLGRAEALPIKDESLDAVFANMCLHHVERPPEAIKEMARILKTSGKLVIADLDEHDFEFLRSEHHDRWMGFKRPDVERWFLEAGLNEVSVDCVGEECCAQSSCGSEYARVSIFVASGKK